MSKAAKRLVIPDVGHVQAPDSATKFAVGGETVVRCLGFGAMRVTGKGTWGALGPKVANSVQGRGESV
jgi:hypothetical protein